MAITNIIKTGGTSMNPILSANIDNIDFTNIPAGGTVGLTDKDTITIDGKTYKIGWSSAEMLLTQIFIN